MVLEGKRPLWSSERAFILSAAAAAVGLGNIWRFPYIAGEHGGAAFILAYLLAVILVGIPLMILEMGMGRQMRGGVVGMFRYLHPKVAFFGWILIGLATLIMSYYLVITGWTLGYAVASFAGNLPSFSEFTSGYASLWYFFLTTLIVGWLVAKGVSSIERMAGWLMPILLLAIVSLAVFGLTLPGRDEALGFLLSPDFSALGQPSLWMFAFGQAFYSLAVGQGYLVTYASYVSDDTDLQRSAVAIAGVETVVALLAGLMIFPVVFTFGFAPDAGSELAFNTLPAVFEIMPLGSVMAIVFFSLFFSAALSSCIAGVKVISTAIHEELRLSRKTAVFLTAGFLLALGIPSALSFTPMQLSVLGLPFLDFMDMFAATQVIVTVGIIGGALIAWLVPRHRLVAILRSRYRLQAYFIVTVGRYLALPVVVVLLYTLLF